LANNWTYQKQTMKEDTNRLIPKHHMNDEWCTVPKYIYLILAEMFLFLHFVIVMKSG
jgi:hypothetical protein